MRKQTGTHEVPGSPQIEPEWTPQSAEVSFSIQGSVDGESFADINKISQEPTQAAQPYPAIRLEDGSIFGVSNILGLRVYTPGPISFVQVMLAGFQEWMTHMRTRDVNRAQERFNELSQYLCDVIIEPVDDPEPVSIGMGPVPTQGMPRRPEQAQYGGFGENRRYPNPTTVGRPTGSPSINTPLYVVPEIAQVPGLTAAGDLPSSKWASSVAIPPKALPE